MDSKANKCRICGNDIDNREYTVRKNMFHIYDEFLYFKCANCGCLQIMDIGCGTCTLLMQLRGFGFSDLTGIDPSFLQISFILMV